ncbi:MAG: hypothetical protein IKK60_09090 [Clostridia bacterium]|nr:hypothetical protein [Clostridia bacterium]
MQSATALIDSFIIRITESELLSDSCCAIRAYESKNLPVPIRKTYFSFSAAENKLYYSFDTDGTKKEINSVKISVNCFIPLELSPAVIYTLTETVMDMLMKGNKDIIGLTVGRIEFDNDVNAFRINSEIHFQTEKKV